MKQKLFSKRMENRIIELLYKLPYRIEHIILDTWFDDKGEIIRGWSKDKNQLFLQINKVENNKFTAFYQLVRFEGEISRLPLKDSEVEEFMEYGCVLQGPEAESLEIVLENLYNWVVKENLINEKNIEEK